MVKISTAFDVFQKHVQNCKLFHSTKVFANISGYVADSQECFESVTRMVQTECRESDLKLIVLENCLNVKKE